MSVEVSKLIMRAVSDAAFREELLRDPAGVGRSEGLGEEALSELSQLNRTRLAKQFANLSVVTIDLSESINAAGHSRDWSGDGNIHNKDDHIHDKETPGSLQVLEQVSNPARLDAAGLKQALRDPAVLREFRRDPELQAILREILE